MIVRDGSEVVTGVLLLLEREDDGGGEQEGQDQEDLDALECDDVDDARVPRQLVVVLLDRRIGCEQARTLIDHRR